ncbi:MAG: hypothetical protein AAF493_00985 [Pseudomonadota bacterium]
MRRAMWVLMALLFASKVQADHIRDVQISPLTADLVQLIDISG